MKRFITAISIALTAAFALSFAAFADIGTDDIRPVTDAILRFKLSESGAADAQEMIDTTLTENAGKTAEWEALILAKSGSYDFSGYIAALEKYTDENTIASATSRIKIALAMLAVGDRSPKIDEIAETSVGEQGIMGMIYGLHLLNNGYTCSRYTLETLTDALLEMQFADGGWAVMGEMGDTDVTAMAVQSLAPQYGSSDKVTAAVDKALALLSKIQQESGGFKSMGTENPESTAQVMIAMSALGIHAEDERFIKNGNTVIDGMLKYRLDDGSFSHFGDGNSNRTATIQAWQSLTAYTLMLEKGERLYDFPESTVTEADPKPAVTSGPAVTEEPVTAVQTTAATTTAAPEVISAKAADNAPADYKPIAYAVIGGTALIVCVILFAVKKRRVSNFVAVALVGTAAAAFIFFTDFRSAEEYYDPGGISKENVVGTVTMTIRCDTLIGKITDGRVPADGCILPETTFELAKDETALDILTEAARKHSIQADIDANGYVRGLAYLYEFDAGDISGWMYYVNGESPSVMSSEYKLAPGDRIEWLYTCELGRDINR